MRTSVSIVLFMAGVAACAGHSGGVVPAGPAIDPADIDSSQYIAHLEPQRMNGSITGIFGDLHVGPGAKIGNSRAELSLQGAPVGAQLAWIIRTGRCGDFDSRDLGLTASYRLVDIRGDGSGSLKVDLPSLMIDGQVSHVEVMAGPGRSRDVVACGNLAQVG